MGEDAVDRETDCIDRRTDRDQRPGAVLRGPRARRTGPPYPPPTHAGALPGLRC